MLVVLLKKKLNGLENYLVKKTGESKVDVHNYVMMFLSLSLGPSKPLRTIPINELGEPINNLISHKEYLVTEIKKYGKVANPIIYKHYNNIADVKVLLLSSVAPIVKQLCLRYKDITDTDKKFDYFDYDFDEAYVDMHIEETFGKDYTLDFITFLTSIIAYELESKVYREDIEAALRILNREWKGTMISVSQINDFYETDVSNMAEIIKYISPSILFKILNYDFKSNNHWPYTDDLVKLLINGLDNFNLSRKTLGKMQLLGCNTYKEIDLGSCIHIMVLKEALKNIPNLTLQDGGVNYD